MISFYRPENANAILHAVIIYPHSTPLRTELYNPNSLLIQCVLNPSIKISNTAASSLLIVFSTEETMVRLIVHVNPTGVR
ncbi:hypothetical protein BO94DRAFT_88181 [Aspergillus sclerotioniger CBS 115572]|uniref:Uncharacterized protein n=1 Tax=Aspergillus sclerotioniger CBS 115572 TaxID=1450535 RepID=A0A317WKN2_9EURO|nr:hypothetical protein BO94DRAFT_88181 [Aspergillus sclerotioniger CBS 115572]PWY86625.1 hypothetical protein BO94DRAFT_88181 [Aspergillus sclerotioniger CBS 115572]